MPKKQADYLLYCLFLIAYKRLLLLYTSWMCSDTLMAYTTNEQKGGKTRALYFHAFKQCTRSFYAIGAGMSRILFEYPTTGLRGSDPSSESQRPRGAAWKAGSCPSYSGVTTLKQKKKKKKRKKKNRRKGKQIHLNYGLHYQSCLRPMTQLLQLFRKR